MVVDSIDENNPLTLSYGNSSTYGHKNENIRW